MGESWTISFPGHSLFLLLKFPSWPTSSMLLLRLSCTRFCKYLFQLNITLIILKTLYMPLTIKLTLVDYLVTLEWMFTGLYPPASTLATWWSPSSSPSSSRWPSSHRLSSWKSCWLVRCWHLNPARSLCKPIWILISV